MVYYKGITIVEKKTTTNETEFKNDYYYQQCVEVELWKHITLACVNNKWNTKPRQGLNFNVKL